MEEDEDCGGWLTRDWMIELSLSGRKSEGSSISGSESSTSSIRACDIVGDYVAYEERDVEVSEEERLEGICRCRGLPCIRSWVLDRDFGQCRE